MKCVYCDVDNTRVTDSRLNEEINSVRRRRECISCKKRFTTYETVEKSPVLVVKDDKRRQRFDKEKVKMGIIKACEKRPVSIDQIDDIVQKVEKKVYNELKSEVPTKVIGKIVMSYLKDTDKIAYIRFASVYKQFEDISNFKEILEDL